MVAAKPSPKNNGAERAQYASPAKIRGAAARLFARRGYYNTSMQDIAAKVGITKGSLYHHIPSKEAILDGLVFNAIQDLLERSEAVAAAALPPDEKLDQMIRLMVQNMAEHQEGTAIYVSERLRLPVSVARKYAQPVRRHRELLSKVVDDFVKEHHLESSCDKSLAVLAILGMINISSLWYKGNGRFVIPQIEQEYLLYSSRVFKRLLKNERRASLCLALRPRKKISFLQSGEGLPPYLPPTQLGIPPTLGSPKRRAKPFHEKRGLFQGEPAVPGKTTCPIPGV